MSAAARDQAREEVFVAEGSDWFWWYGDDHSSAHDLGFDDLFRRHLRNVYRLLQKPVPDELFQTNISTGGSPLAGVEPVGFLHPTIDGEETSYFEWLGAGTLEAQDTAGAMHQASRRPPVIELIRFGFDPGHFYLRIDAGREVRDLMAANHRLTIRVPPARACSEPQPGGDQLTNGSQAAAGAVLEIAIPLADLGVTPGESMSFVVTLSDPSGTELERHPEHQPIELRVPDAGFEARNWTV